jgi:nucleoside-diphosphate-sugar epimerase
MIVKGSGMSISLVTGGAGFIGSHVAEYLLQSGHQVVVLDDLSGGYERNVPEGAHQNVYGEVYDIGADHPYTVLELAEIVQEVMGSDAGVTYLPARNEVKHAYSDHSKAQATFGETDAAPLREVPLREGLECMARWAKTVGPQKPSVFGAIEINRGLPPSWAKVLQEG